ncbi:MAG TPA: aminotransferase class I/II-fold pyridoxal phosphate-dependent enzyme [Puia sp.]|nr:aminotransferase class I/II-fold pyridoxal phosphate-dependent enzyme [Puia sp.]
MKKENYFPSILHDVKINFDLLKEWMNNHNHLEWIEPTGGVICFPRFKKEIKIDVEKFYKILLEHHKTYVGPGHWFEQSKRNFRLGFGWEKQKTFEKGLENIDKAIVTTIQF